ncbi:MAG TPA: alpha/beta fold hydrolase [Pseudolabrys sp.]|nr:alpha/beta fold hydrolase [Pseudolabrys sp.]
MIAFWLRRILAIFAVAALAQYFTPYPKAAALGVIGVFLALHTGIVVASFVVTRRHAARTPAWPSLGLLTAISVFLREWLAYLALYVVIQPFEQVWMGDDASGRAAPGTIPVLLIHGYLCNRSAWWWLRRKLRVNAFTTATINLEPPLGSIDVFADQLHARIETLCADTEASQVSLLGHSMGGLVARAYLRKHGPARIAKLVTLASPHRGTWVARYGIGESAREMEPGSAWMQNLQLSEPGVPTLCIWSPADNFVVPQTSGRIENACDKMVPALGHVTELFSPLVLDILVSELAHRSDR